jgi:putative transposase
MTSSVRDPLYRRHRFPDEVIANAVWLYFRLSLSLRMVEDLLAAHGIIVSHQTVRLWVEKFGRYFANEIRRRSAGKLGVKWHRDEVVISIGGKKHWLWRAVDQDGFVLDVLVQSPPQHQGCQTSDAKASERTGEFATRHDHRQAAILWSRKTRHHARHRAPLPQRAEQSG